MVVALIFLAFVLVLILRAAAFKPKAEEAVEAKVENFDREKAVEHLYESK